MVVLLHKWEFRNIEVEFLKVSENILSPGLPDTCIRTWDFLILRVSASTVFYTVMNNIRILHFGKDRPEQTVYRLIRVYTVCHSSSCFGTHQEEQCSKMDFVQFLDKYDKDSIFSTEWGLFSSLIRIPCVSLSLPLPLPLGEHSCLQVPYLNLNVQLWRSWD